MKKWKESKRTRKWAREERDERRLKDGEKKQKIG